MSCSIGSPTEARPSGGSSGLHPLPLIRNGRWIRANLKHQWITTEEVEAKLREHGIESVSQVRAAYLEPSGELGVIKIGESEPPAGREQTARP